MNRQYVYFILIILFILLINYSFQSDILLNKYKIVIPKYTPRVINETINNPYNIPLTIYQSWHSNIIPNTMALYIKKLIDMNPEFDYYLYSDENSRLFIKDNFNEDVLNAFDTLIPGAYKSDLWRYCILYVKGGIYLDLKFYCKIPLKNILIYGSTVFVKDRFLKNMVPREKYNIYNALMVSIPYNIIFKHCIDDIVNSCKLKLYKENPLAVTGPELLGFIVMKYEPEKYNDYVKFIHEDGGIVKVINNNIVILGEYSEYRKEQQFFQKTKRYNELWHERKIYNM